MDLDAPTARILEILGVDEPLAPYVSILRTHTSADAMSQHLANVTPNRCAERAPTPADAARFTELHAELRALGTRELDRFTLFLQKVSERGIARYVDPKAKK